ncbi:MAG TPA: RagB/SusD family nutrient uptake outer membrane protein, partial [Ferruginibacter sp.]|nr:RagB/SusD family nutrient uptake outer membrane protein [Ferruginibacter sp.]
NTSPANLFLHGVYYKSIYQITLVNEFLRQATEDKLVAKGFAGADADEIRKYRPEVRFLRAFQYWVLIDLFGNPPFVTEESQIGGANPPQKTRAEVFAYIESELKAIETTLPAARSNEYGRADQAAAWALLARLYLNAEVYTGTAKYTEAATYAKKVIDAGYSLMPDYRHLLLADNNLNNPEFIFTINYDGSKTQGYGGTTFLIKGGIGGNMISAASGVNEGWSGHRSNKALVDKFTDPSGATDKRAQFVTAGQQKEIDTVSSFRNGYAVVKYRNLTKTGGPASNTAFSDVDVPLFRLAEMYLIYAEAFKRNGTADANLALTYLNKLRERAYGNTSGNIVANDITLDYILDERARELYWEGHRRTDLVRFGRFTEGTYLWPWKGGVKSGTAVSNTRKLYPIPSADMNANRNLVQNPGY